MQELADKTYNFAVKGIGFIKSLDKIDAEINTNELKQCAGAVSLKFIAAMDSKENDDFANNLRECYNNIIKTLEQLKNLNNLKEKSLENQRNELITEAEEITKDLNKIIEKVIY
ncbi:MAG TPA: four helix bundle protein [Bacteroidales bacterium]|nr:four helix bundle protein [Bacteroidales bacterium]